MFLTRDAQIMNGQKSNFPLWAEGETINYILTITVLYIKSKISKCIFYFII